METRNTPSSENGIWIWIMLAILLVITGAVSVGSLAWLNTQQQGQVATAPQATPSVR